MPKLSAGLLLYRVRDGVVEVLIAHPGGPFWARKDDGAWSIPKGEYAQGEDPWAAAQREFEEEIGSAPPAGPRIESGPGQAARRQGRHRVRGAGRPRPRRCAQQYLRTRMAKGLRANRRPSRRSTGSSGSRWRRPGPSCSKASVALLDQLDGRPRAGRFAGGLTNLAYVHTHADAAHARRPVHGSTRIPLYPQTISTFPTTTAGRCGWPGCKTARPTPTRC